MGHFAARHFENRRFATQLGHVAIQTLRNSDKSIAKLTFRNFNASQRGHFTTGHFATRTLRSQLKFETKVHNIQRKSVAKCPVS
uniref:Uncharacterized protein n=1 Tax=Caenorhabditis japonica TaxID=281687 RepID=A0A8R1EC59_CAEJA